MGVLGIPRGGDDAGNSVSDDIAVVGSGDVAVAECGKSGVSSCNEGDALVSDGVLSGFIAGEAEPVERADIPES